MCLTLPPGDEKQVLYLSARQTNLRLFGLSWCDPPRSVAPSAPANLHINACGDFTLMAREHWMDLRGYPEFDMFSFNIDALFCYAAHYGGVREAMLTEPLRIYHIEHDTGSGWTPEGQANLFERLRAKGINWIEIQEVLELGTQMQKLNSPIIFNCENWGLSEFELPE
jgi:hypothetical protein